MEEYLRKYSKYLSIRAIEGAIGCPVDTLQKVVQGRKLPKKWEQPLIDFFAAMEITSNQSHQVNAIVGKARKLKK
jgi:hypothetical protein